MDHPILGQIALSYSPVIDRNRAVTATRLTVWPINPSQRLDAAALLAALGEVWPVGGPGLWLNVANESLLQDLMAAQPGTHIFIEVPAFMACDPANVDALCTLQ